MVAMEQRQLEDSMVPRGSETCSTRGPILLITTVDIGGGRSDKIELRQGDVPQETARLFCLAHSIPDTVIPPLTEHIKDNLRKAGIALDEATGAAKGAPAAHTAGDLLGTADVPSKDGYQAVQLVHPESDRDSPLALSQQHQAQLAAAAQKLSFADGMNDRLYEQLSQKLLPVDDQRGLLSVSTSIANQAISRPGTGKALSLASERPYRTSQSAEGSPRVHTRLYRQAQDQRQRHEARRHAVEHELENSLHAGRTSMSWISQEMMRDRSHGPFENYGEMLYAEGLEAAAHRKAKAAAVREARDARELEGVTFMPEITQLAAALWAGDDLESQPAWQRLSANKRSKTLERIQEMKSTKEKQELQECTFRPRINRNSVNLMTERAEAQRVMKLSAHEQLYADAVRRQQKMEALKTWQPEGNTFKPAVNKTPAAEAALLRSLDALGVLHKSNSENGSASGCESPSSPGAGDSLGAVSSSSFSVVDRLYLSYEKTKQKLEDKRAVLNGDIDPETGRPYYQPRVGRAPSNQGPRASLPIGDYLYSSGVEFLNKKEAHLEAVRVAEREAANSSHATSTSQKMFDKLRAKRFKQIFEYLDGGSTSGMLDLVGLVRKPTTQMDNLDNEVREDVEAAAATHARLCGVPLMPTSDSMVECEDGIDAAVAKMPLAPFVDLAAFSGLMDEALSKRRKPRAYLVPSPSAKQAPAHTFQPAINKRSKELAARMRPSELATHDLLHHSAEVVRAKLEAARRAAEEAELAGCTFAPNLNPTVGGGETVEGRALRAARNAIANGATIRASRMAPAVESPPPLVTAPITATGSTGAGSARARTANSGVRGQQQQLQLSALEQEVQEALSGVAAATARLGALEHVPATSCVSLQQSLCHDDRDASVDSTADPTPGDLRATEAMLLEMLAASPNALDTSADEAVINQLHALFVEGQQGGSGAVHVVKVDPTANTKEASSGGIGSMRKRPSNTAQV